MSEALPLAQWTEPEDERVRVFLAELHMGYDSATQTAKMFAPSLPPEGSRSAFVLSLDGWYRVGANPAATAAKARWYAVGDRAISL
jgi:hypothetical protein